MYSSFFNPFTLNWSKWLCSVKIFRENLKYRPVSVNELLFISISKSVQIITVCMHLYVFNLGSIWLSCHTKGGHGAPPFPSSPTSAPFQDTIAAGVLKCTVEITPMHKKLLSWVWWDKLIRATVHCLPCNCVPSRWQRLKDRGMILQSHTFEAFNGTVGWQI